jgi:hypothetical protein
MWSLQIICYKLVVRITYKFIYITCFHWLLNKYSSDVHTLDTVVDKGAFLIDI